MLWGILVILIIAVDRAAKILVIKSMKINESITVINNFFYINYIENKGAAMGILQNGRYFFIPMTIIVAAVLIYVLVKAKNNLLKLTLTFILGGAIGNFIDRALWGSVIDFLHFRFWSYDFYIFNVADAFIVVGTILLAYYLLFIHKDKEKQA